MATFDGYEVQTHGNPYAHYVLRGSNSSTNYSIQHIEEVKHYMDIHNIKNPSLIIDASHDNCMINGKKEYRLQPLIISEIMNNLIKRPDLKGLIKGFMLESFIKGGNQKVDLENPEAIDMSGLSITDPCLSWEDTEKFILNLVSQ